MKGSQNVNHHVNITCRLLSVCCHFFCGDSSKISNKKKIKRGNQIKIESIQTEEKKKEKKEKPKKPKI